MKFFLKPAVLLWAIVLVALFVRTYDIGNNPPAISWDEASIGYNAYTILTTGRDEHGRFLPMDTFAAFGDYKPPVPVYLTVPFIAMLGMNEWAVRLPSAIAGTMTVFVMYLLMQELLAGRSRGDSVGGLSVQDIALTGSGLLALTPWHIMLSRAGFEANLALLFLMTGALWVLKARNHPSYLYVCWLPFVLGIYTFNSTRYAGPLIAMALLIHIWRRITANKTILIRGMVIALLSLLPIFPHLFSKEARLRFQEVSIFTDLRTVITSNDRRELDGYSWWSAILHNRRIGYAREYLVHFFDNLEPRFLFIRGDGNPKFSIQDTGQLLLVTAPFLIFGILSLMRDNPKVAWLLVFWLIASLAPTAVARETPHALRIENSLPVFIIATSYGILMSVFILKRQKFRIVYGIVLTMLIFGNFLYFWHNLVSHYPKEFSGTWQYGYKQAIRYAESVKHTYDRIVISESIGRPYIYALFYGRYGLGEFEKTKDASFDAAGFYNVYGFGPYRFTKDGVGEYGGHTLYILPPKDVPGNANVHETIRLLDGTPILIAFE